jgi:UDP-N-acetylglucosamine--N-acetylmuramyl-(pentapeptide) pyrophosphoryl-undecaprenol N-acetylglucosamine transferase
MVGPGGTTQPRKRRLLLTGGGTAGHVNPLLAVLERLEARDRSIKPLWIGSERIESQLVPAAGVPFQRIDIRFSYRLPTPDNWAYYRDHIVPLMLGRPFAQARAALEGFRPDLVLASGGYVSAPAIWAAQELGIPVALLQLDDPPGLVNYHFAERAWLVLCSTGQVARQFDGRTAPSKVEVCGYPALTPRRAAPAVFREYGIDEGRRVLLAMGGSLGTGAVHRAVLDFMHETIERPRARWLQLAVVHVAGERTELLDTELAQSAIGMSAVQYVRVNYLSDPMGALLASDFYFGRCGAATTGELLATGLPALVMPDPQHTDRQQYGNARALQASGQGALLEQGSSDHGRQLLDWLLRVWQQERVPPPSPPAADLAAESLLEAWA